MEIGWGKIEGGIRKIDIFQLFNSLMSSTCGMFLTKVPSKCKAYYKSLNILHTHETFGCSVKPGVRFLQCEYCHIELFSFFFHFLQSALISEEKAAEFRHQVYLPIMLTKVVEYLLIALGALFILVAFVLLLLACRKTKGRIEMCLINEVDTALLLSLWPKSLPQRFESFQ